MWTSGTFICLECQTVVPDVEQQFKFTQVGAELRGILRDHAHAITVQCESE